jgi:hypothetical protein
MKKNFLSIFILLMGLSTFARAQAPCRTVETCETLRVNAHQLLTEQKASKAVHATLDQKVNKQIKDLPWLWPQGNTIQDLQWSGVLEDEYDNLDLDKNKPPMEGIIQYSHATEACKTIGGRLATKEEFKKLEADWHDESILSKNFKNKMKGQWFWSSSVHPGNLNGAYFFNGNDGSVDYYYFRSNQGSVRCVAR